MSCNILGLKETTRSLQTHLEETFEVRGEKSAAQRELEQWHAQMSIGSLRCVCVCVRARARALCAHLLCLYAVNNADVQSTCHYTCIHAKRLRIK
jgi:hypothetical protein